MAKEDSTDPLRRLEDILENEDFDGERISIRVEAPTSTVRPVAKPENDPLKQLENILKSKEFEGEKISYHPEPHKGYPRIALAVALAVALAACAKVAIEIYEMLKK